MGIQIVTSFKAIATSYTTFQWEVVAHFRSCNTPIKVRNVLHQL